MNDLVKQILEDNKKTKNPYLDLGRCGLTEIPKEVFSYNWIETLILSNSYWDYDKLLRSESANKGPKNFIVDIPAAISKLNNLKHLKIGSDWQNSSRLFGTENIGKLTNLLSLDLRGNKLEDLSFLSELANLTILNLSSNKIQNIGTLKQLTKLGTINLRDNQIEDASALSELTDLKSINIAGNQIKNASFLTNLTSLVTLNLTNNQIEDASALSDLTHLISLDIRGNQLIDVSFLTNLTELNALKLSNNQIEDISALSGLTNLTSLLLIGNQINDASALAGLIKLTSLSISKNQVKEADFLKDLTSLTFLDLRNNQIEDASFIKNLTQLNTLDLRSNQITDYTFLSELSNLNFLNFSGKKMQDYSFLSVLSSLTKLDLSGKNIQDYSFLSSLSNLTALNLSNKTIEDYSFLSNLTNLTSLDLRGNKIEDASFLSGLTKLTILNLRDNQLEDASCLSGLTNLTSLDLRGNQIKDVSALSKLTKLTNLNLIRNKVEDASALSDLTNLTTLNLSGNEISDAGFLSDMTKLVTLNLSSNLISDASFLFSLSSLTALDLRNNQIEGANFLLGLINLTSLGLSNKKTENTSLLSEQTSLISLDLRGNQIEDASFLSGLTSLTSLDLTSNKIEDASTLSGLTNLISLNLTGNQIKDARFLTSLTRLTSLNLTGNNIRDPRFISKLTNLRYLNLKSNHNIQDYSFLPKLNDLNSLNLSNNRILDASFLSELTSLLSLNLTGNQIRNTSFLSKLTNLTSLVLAGNQVEDVSFLSKLKSLSSLNLSSNNIKDARSLSEATNLTALNLSDNQIKDARFLTKLTNLNSLNLSDNKIHDIKPLLSVIRSKKLEVTLVRYSTRNWLNLFNNPITSPPIEIVEQGNEAIINYFDQIRDGKDYLYEAKLLVVGEERAGKSTIVEALRNPDFKINGNNLSTEGIDIVQWPITKEKINKEKDFLFNVWDFGGQEIYHATHQFFLTKRSLYLFVTEARKDLRFDDFYYWLNIINTLAGDSPVILIQNKTDQDHKNPSIEEYQELFPQIQFDLQRISCNSEHEDWENIYKPKVEILKENIYKVLKEKKLEGIGDSLPKAWVQIREQIQKLQDEGANHLTLTDYLKICSDSGLNDEQAFFLSDYFHDLGVFLHFRKDFHLRHIIFINHEWVTKAVYNVLDNRKVKEANGRFNNEDLINIWSEDKFKNRQPELLKLLLNPEFKLCFEKGPDEYLAPQLFSDKPMNYEWRTNEDNLNFHYQYKFMPKGILSQLIVSLHDHIYEDTFWLNGVLFEYKDSRAIVKEVRFGEKKIMIQVEGRAKRELLTIIVHKLEEINDSYTNLKITELFGCNCDECRTSNTPYTFEGRLISKAIRKGVDALRCGESMDMVNITSLLGDYVPKHLIVRQMYLTDSAFGKGDIDKILRNTQSLKEGQKLFNEEQKRMGSKLDQIHVLMKDMSNEITIATEQILQDIESLDDNTFQSDAEEHVLSEKMDALIKQLDQIEIANNEKKEIKEALNDTDLSLKQKLKFAIPLWLFKYEAELEFSNKQQLPKTWKEWKALFWDKNKTA